MVTRVWAYAPVVGGMAALSLTMMLAACDGAPSANPARAHASGAADRRLADNAPAGDDSRAPAQYRPAVYSSDGPVRREAEPAPLFHGKPMWASNKKHTAQENADYHFKRDGEAMGAASEDDFLTKVHAFVDNPPKGTEILTRSNGDRLMYDPKSDLFAVVDKDGAPRTLFKPRGDGAAHWAQQKQTLAEDGGDDRRATKRKSARRSSGDDNG